MTDVSVATLVGSLNQEATQQSVLSVMQGMAADIANGITATVDDFPTDYPDSAANVKLNSIISALGSTLNVSFTRLSSSTDSVALGASSAVIGHVVVDSASVAQLPSTLGQKNAADSLSIIPASDAVHVVAGQAAVGSAPTVAPVGVSGVDGGGLKRSLLTDTNGRVVTVASDNMQSIVTFPDIISSGAISALYVNDSTAGGSLKVAIPTGYRSATIYIRAGDTFTGSLLTKVTDANGSWQSLIGLSVSSNSTPINGFTYSGTTTYFPAKFTIPAGSTYLSVQCSAFTSGSCVAYIVLSTETPTTVVTGVMTLGTGSARIGAIAAASIWYDDTSTALSGGATFTSTARDVTVSVTAAASLTSYPKEYRVTAVQDVGFTLYLEVSRDNSTFRRIKQVIAAQNVTSGLYLAELRETPAWRYYRYAIVNGASAATHTTGGSILTSA